jgi:deoxyribonuclease V
VVDLPTIGIGKNFLVIDDGPNLQMHHVKTEAKRQLMKRGDVLPLQGGSGIIYGAAVRTTDSASNPIFISQGHRISLETAIQITLSCCRFRIPEPIRRADQDSRAYIQAARKSVVL